MIQNEVAYVETAGKQLKCEVIRVRGDQAEMQIFEDAKGLSVGDQVTFHGFVPWQRLVEEMQQSDVFVFSSIWDEPFAITPLVA